MRIANVDGRLSLVTEAGKIDVSRASDGRFPSDPQAVFDVWSEFRDWSAGFQPNRGDDLDESLLRAPAPRPRQVFGIGLNYRAHAAETSFEVPSFPNVFTKFPSCITGQDAHVHLPTAMVDWEVELVVVIGAECREIEAGYAWDCVAGLTVGQDISERKIMLEEGPWPQVSLGKSHPGFGPIGPYLVTPDELPNPNDLSISCRVNDDEVQRARTSEMVFDVPTTIAKLSAIVTLFPGDLIFTGTPAGVGVSRDPRWFLKPGDTLISTIEGLGTLRTYLM